MAIEKERDREASENKLIAAVGELIEEVGFEKLGINQVAKRAGFSKNLIYRYFGSLDGLIYAYIKRHDIWLNEKQTPPDSLDLKEYLKALIRKEITEFRYNVDLKRLRRWELSTNNDIIDKVRAQREEHGVQFINILSQFFKVDKKHLQAILSLITASITYLSILEDNCQMYNDINIQSDQGWEQIAKSIDHLIDLYVK